MVSISDEPMVLREGDVIGELSREEAIPVTLAPEYANSSDATGSGLGEAERKAKLWDIMRKKRTEIRLN